MLIFFFNDTATTEIYTLSLHDALPICFSFTSSSGPEYAKLRIRLTPGSSTRGPTPQMNADRKSTRLNSSHGYISYAVFCLEKKADYATLHTDQERNHFMHREHDVISSF